MSTEGPYLGKTWSELKQHEALVTVMRDDLLAELVAAELAREDVLFINNNKVVPHGVPLALQQMQAKVDALTFTLMGLKAYYRLIDVIDGER